MNTQKIVITGGPGTGKTSVIDWLQKAGYFCFEEVIRSITKEVKDAVEITSNPIVSVTDPTDFNKKLLKGRIDQFKQGDRSMKNHVFYDRGIPDILAYMDFFTQKYDAHFTDACKNYRYEKIFILPPWKDIYISDNERFESYEEAEKIHLALENTYKMYDYSPITVPFGTVEERSRFILTQMV